MTLSDKDRFGLETALKTAGVEITPAGIERLKIYVGLLRAWQPAQNLVAARTLDDVWARHIADGLQLLPLLEAWRDSHDMANGTSLNGVDLGSGAGLPGAILAIAGADSTTCPLSMTLVEANTRKCAFLRTVSRETGVPIRVVNARIETLELTDAPDVAFVTARALAPLSTLVHLAFPWLSKGATAFFHKGGETLRELSEWSDSEEYDVVDHISRVDPDSRILQITKKR